MPGDVRLTQLARILDLSSDRTDEAAVRAAVSARAEDVTEGLFQEAVASDDVIDEESAREYLEARLAFLGELIPAEAATLVRSGFEQRLRAWQ